MRKSLLAPQRWDAGKEHSSIDVSSESEAKVLWVICGSVRYYCCGTTSFSLKNRLKSDNWSPIDNYQILHVSPFSSVFSQHEETGKVITSLVFFISSSSSFLFLHSSHEDSSAFWLCYTSRTSLYSPAPMHRLLLFTCWGGCNTRFVRIQRVPLYSGMRFWFRATLHMVNNFCSIWKVILMECR